MPDGHSLFVFNAHTKGSIVPYWHEAWKGLDCMFHAVYLDSDANILSLIPLLFLAVTVQKGIG